MMMMMMMMMMMRMMMTSTTMMMIMLMMMDCFQSAERSFPTVTAMTGVIEKDLNDFLTANGVAMLSQPLNDVESFGGMVAAATHVSFGAVCRSRG
jgi:hypothetical protein